MNKIQFILIMVIGWGFMFSGCDKQPTEKESKAISNIVEELLSTGVPKEAKNSILSEPEASSSIITTRIHAYTTLVVLAQGNDKRCEFLAESYAPLIDAGDTLMSINKIEDAKDKYIAFIRTTQRYLNSYCGK